MRRTNRYHRCNLCFEHEYGRDVLFVPSPDEVFVAPELISHYIESHDYLPPEAFIAAVMRCPSVDSDEYREALAKHRTPAPVVTADTEYAPQNALVLEGLEPVRQRPGMYIGGTNAVGLHHMILEVISNSLDEHLAGFASRVLVEVRDEWVTVEDDGRGFPVEATVGDLSALEAVFRRLHSGPTLDGHHPHVHAHPVFGIGVAVVNALSSRLEVEARRNGTRWTAAFERSELVEPLTNAGPTAARGTRIRFRYDEEIFGPARIDLPALAARLDELGYFLPKLDLRLNGRSLRHAGGLSDWLPTLSSDLVQETVLSTSGRHDDIDVEFALAWSPTNAQSVVTSWVNLGPTPEHGKHLEGFRAALAASAPTKYALSTMERGLVAVVHTKLLAPQFGGPTKSHLLTKEAKVAVEAVVGKAMRAAPWWWDRVLELSR
ncbi:MAG: ATP-binding protein [Myxococcota bacterium]